MPLKRKRERSAKGMGQESVWQNEQERERKRGKEVDTIDPSGGYCRLFGRVDKISIYSNLIFIGIHLREASYQRLVASCIRN